MTEFTVEDLKRILSAGAGVAEDIDLDADIADTSFSDLGYDSLAVLELTSRIEREYALAIPDGELEHTRTLREAAAYVHSRLTEVKV